MNRTDSLRDDSPATLPGSPHVTRSESEPTITPPLLPKLLSLKPRPLNCAADVAVEEAKHRLDRMFCKVESSHGHAPPAVRWPHHLPPTSLQLPSLRSILPDIEEMHEGPKASSSAEAGPSQQNHREREDSVLRSFPAPPFSQSPRSSRLRDDRTATSDERRKRPHDQSLSTPQRKSRVGRDEEEEDFKSAQRDFARRRRLAPPPSKKSRRMDYGIRQETHKEW